MSDNTQEKQQSNQSQDSSARTDKKESSRKSLKKLNLNQDLKEALNSFDAASEKAKPKASNRTPSDEKLQEMKKLLSELQTKLSEF
ncbi:MAG: hypothetical protein ACXVCY_07455 [Pseudobdellovibrionaceae bacterium]